MLKLYLNLNSLYFLLIIGIYGLFVSCVQQDKTEAQITYETDRYVLEKHVSETTFSSTDKYILIDKKTHKKFIIPDIHGWIICDSTALYTPAVFGAKYCKYGIIIEVIKSQNDSCIELKYSDCKKSITNGEGFYRIIEIPNFQDTISDSFVGKVSRISGLDTMFDLHTLQSGKYYFSSPGFLYTNKITYDSIVVNNNLQEN